MNQGENRENPSRKNGGLVAAQLKEIRENLRAQSNAGLEGSVTYQHLVDNGRRSKRKPKTEKKSEASGEGNCSDFFPIEYFNLGAE